MHRVGVDLRDDVLAHEPDRLEGLLAGAPCRCRRPAGRRRPPPTAGTARGRGRGRRRSARRSIVYVERLRRRVGDQLGPVRHPVGVREGVVVAEHVALQVVRLRVEQRLRGASSPSSATKAPVVTMMLSLTKAPIGSALAIVLLVGVDDRLQLVDGRRPRSRARRGPCGPPSRSSTVLPAAYHIAGCGFVVRLGQDLAGRQRPVLALVALVGVLHPHLGELADDVLPDLPGARQVGRCRAGSRGSRGCRRPGRCRTRSGRRRGGRAWRPARPPWPGGSPAAAG